MHNPKKPHLKLKRTQERRDTTSSISPKKSQQLDTTPIKEVELVELTDLESKEEAEEVLEIYTTKSTKKSILRKANKEPPNKPRL